MVRAPFQYCRAGIWGRSTNASVDKIEPNAAQYLISDPNDEIKDTLMKFGDDTKLRGEVDTLEGRASLLDRLKEQMNKNLMKDKCNISWKT